MNESKRVEDLVRGDCVVFEGSLCYPVARNRGMVNGKVVVSVYHSDSDTYEIYDGCAVHDETFEPGSMVEVLHKSKCFYLMPS